MRSLLGLCLGSALAFVGACGAGSDEKSAAKGARDAGARGSTDARVELDGAPTDANVDERRDAGSPMHSGPYVVGTARIEVEVASDRVLPVQLWYPANDDARSEAEQGHPLEELEPEGEKRTRLATMVASAPDKCTSKLFHAAVGAGAFAGSERFPLVVFSHCMDCIRFSALTIAEHLASRGFVVAAPDHVGGTLYENKGVLSAEFLQTRASDIRTLLDKLLDPSTSALPADLRGKLDPERVGAMGHSYGSVTTGLVLTMDARVKAGVMIAAPPQSPLLAGVDLSQATQPGLFIEAMEDHSIQLVGNQFLESNYGSYPKPAWLLKVNDAGHWSFSDICGLGGNFKPGCGMDTRQANPLASFDYLDIDEARGLAKAYIAAFFGAHLLGDQQGRAYLDQATPADVVGIEHHE